MENITFHRGEKIKIIYKTWGINRYGEYKVHEMSDYIRNYFNNDDYYVTSDSKLGWYNFEIGNNRMWETELNRINKQYKVFLEDGYFIFGKVDD